MTRYCIELREVDSATVEYVIEDQDTDTVLAHVRSDGGTPNPDYTGGSIAAVPGWKCITINAITALQGALAIAVDNVAAALLAQNGGNNES